MVLLLPVETATAPCVVDGWVVSTVFVTLKFWYLGVLARRSYYSTIVDGATSSDAKSPGLSGRTGDNGGK